MEADFFHYPEWDIDLLLKQLCVVTTELYNAHKILASTVSQEKSARAHAYRASEENTVTGRERDADMQALPLTLGAIEIRAQISALIEERDLLRLLIGLADASERRAVDHPEGLLAGD